MTNQEVVQDLSLKYEVSEKEIEDYCVTATGVKAQFLNFEAIKELALEVAIEYRECELI